MSSLRLFLLGTPRLERDGVPLKFDTRKNMALIAYLAVTGERHSREVLVTLLWPELEPSRARAGLRRNLSGLRSALGGEWLVVDRQTVGTDPDADFWLDVDCFRTLVSTGQTHGHAEADVCPACLGDLTDAVELCRGDFLEGFGLRDSAAFDDWQFFQTEGLRRELASALERLVRGHSDQGTWQAAIPHARRWLALDPLHEPAHQALMLLYARSGQRAAALRQYQECVQVLDEELGLPPSEETTALFQQIRTGALERDFPVSVTPAVRHNLPASATPFVGRREAKTEVSSRLSEPGCRLLTLLGPGGIGKTRLALQVASELVEAGSEGFEHGVYFVPLNPLQASECIVPAVAEAVGFTFFEEGTPRQQLLDYLQQKRMLLVMDNFEHLLPTQDTQRGNGVGFVTDVLENSPELKILATSRSRLQMQGEHLYLLTGMRVPEYPVSGADETAQRLLDYGAVQLFIQGARRVRPDFEPEATDWEHIVRICQLVQGMPLGILLASAWVEMLSPREIADEIGRSLDFLEADLRDLPERQRSIRAAFDHSWRLLTEREREVFQGVSVFCGGFERQAALEVAGASIQELMALANKSLLHRMPTGRYQVHELLRQYAAERLRQAPALEDAVCDRHCAYFVAALERWTEDLKGAEQQAALVQMDIEIENVRTAWNWAVELGHVDRLDRALEGLELYYYWRGRNQEGESALRAAAERLELMASVDARRVWAKALAGWSRFRYQLGLKDRADPLLEQSLAVLEELEQAGVDTRAERAAALVQIGHYHYYPEPRDAQAYYEQGLALFEALGDRWGAARALDYLGWVAEHMGNYARAQALCEKSLAIRRDLGDVRGMIDSLFKLGLISWVQGDVDRAVDLHRQGLACCRSIGDRARIAEGLKSLGESLVRRGEFDEGLPLIEESVASYSDLGHLFGGGWVIPFVAEAKLHLGRYEEAVGDARAGLVHAERINHWWGVGFSQFVMGLAALAREAYADAFEVLDVSSRFFEELKHPENLAWVLGPLGLAARGTGQEDLAREHIVSALRTSSEIGAFIPVMYALPAVVFLLLDRGWEERAVEVYALASRYGFVRNSLWFKDVAGRPLAVVEAGLSPEVIEAARERGRAKDLNAAVAELLAELN